MSNSKFVNHLKGKWSLENKASIILAGAKLSVILFSIGLLIFFTLLSIRAINKALNVSASQNLSSSTELFHLKNFRATAPYWNIKIK